MKSGFIRGSGNPDCGLGSSEKLQDYGTGIYLEDCKMKCLELSDCTDFTWAPGNSHCVLFNGCENAGSNTGWHHYIRKGMMKPLSVWLWSISNLYKSIHNWLFFLFFKFCFLDIGNDVEECKLDLLSYGGDDRPFNKGFIKINGRQVTRNEDSRGFTLVRINGDCSVKEIKRYDTHISTQESYNLRDYLQSLPNNTRIAGITYDEYVDHLSSSSKSTLSNVGLDLSTASWRSSLCFILIKGKPQLTKQSQAAGAKGPASLSTTFQIV